MGEKVLMKGNEVIAEAAIRAGCRHYFGYPITPQTQIAEYMAKKLPQVGGVFLQAESEIAAINMVYGAAAAGKRVMTSSSSPGVSLKQEGISYIAGAQLPAVLVNIVRCGPGLGGILPGQCDYFQAVKGGGHGDFRNVVLAPCSIQEMYELTVEAFNIADKYRVLCMIMGDGILGQMMEAVEYKDKEDIIETDKSWAATGTKMQRQHNVITSIYIDPDELEAHNNMLQEKYRLITKNETRCEIFNCDGAEIIIAAYGTCGRVARNVIAEAGKRGLKVGLIRPVTLWPFPSDAFKDAVRTAKAFLTVEMSAGQMVEDVRLAVNGARPVYFHGRTGGNVPEQKDLLELVMKLPVEAKGGQ